MNEALKKDRESLRLERRTIGSAIGEIVDNGYKPETSKKRVIHQSADEQMKNIMKRNFEGMRLSFL